MYDFRMIKGVQYTDDAPVTDYSTLVAPADLIKDLEANPESTIGSLFGGVVDEHDVFRPRRDGEEITHYINSARCDMLILTIGSRSIMIPAGNCEFAKMFERLAMGLVCFTMDEINAVYGNLTNGSRYYLTKKKADLKVVE